MTLHDVQTRRTSDPQRLDQMMQTMIGDLGAAFSGALVLLGDRLGLYRALDALGPTDSDSLAAQCDIDPRYAREWLSAQAAAGYIAYDGATDRFWLTPEQAMVFADDASPVFFAGAYDMVQSVYHDVPVLERAFRERRGVGWHEHHPCLFRGTERFFRPGYVANLVSSWLPALDGVVEKLERGVAVADFGCGHGASTILMARAFPNSRFTGFDYHGPSIERAREAAEEANSADNLRFEVAGAKQFGGGPYDLITCFDCLHDMGDPVGVGRHVRSMLAADGTWMLVEPFAHDTLAENLNPFGQLFYAASTMICTPASRAQEVGLALGAQAGEKRLTDVLHEAGFIGVRRAVATPINLVMEARA
ncbi:MAG: SAM-dependent methyltransferase [Rhodospirillales bacterium]|nr:SAM-dependent methyltransferase [Rhodospirillales bacterium]